MLPEKLQNFLEKYLAKRAESLSGLLVQLALICLVIVVSGRLVWITIDYLRERISQGDGGIVIVDSPEIYSRERLINDRFRQAGWLEDELEESPDRDFGNQGITDLRQIWRLDLTSGNISDSNSNSQDRNGETRSSPDTDVRTRRKSGDGLSVTPTERFRDVLAYREEIRTEMMETLLDDRHDIKGNTLYRLKFDTTVLPEENTHKLAVVQVKVSLAEFCEDSDSNPAPCMSIKTMHREWMKRTEDNINNALEGMINDIRKMSLPPQEFGKFVRFLKTAVNGASAKGSLESAKQNVKYWDKLTSVNRTCLEKRWRPDYMASDRMQKRTGDSNGNKKDDEKDIGTKVTSKEERTTRQDSETGGSNGPASKSTLSLSLDNFSDGDIKACFSKAYSFFVPGANLVNKYQYENLRELLYEYHEVKHSDKSKLRKSFDMLVDAHKAFKIGEGRRTIVPENSATARKQPETHDDPYDLAHLVEEFSQNGNTLDHFAFYDKEKIKQRISAGEIAELSLLRSTVGDYLIEKYKFEKDEKKNCADFYRRKLGDFGDESLGCLVVLKKDTCEKVEHCSILVEAKYKPDMDGNASSKQAVNTGNCLSIKKPNGDMSHKCSEDHFKDLLVTGNSYYSYAISPKESTQRVLSVTSERRQKQLALMMIAQASDRLDTDALQSLIKHISESSIEIEQIQRRPLILSFGRGQHKHTNAVLAAQNKIDFGWFIGPKYIVSGSQGSKVNFVQAPVQYSLSAVVSVPSWWTVLNLDIDTCWVNQNQISDRGLIGDEHITNICSSASIDHSHVNTYRYSVRLPGSVAELPRKFGYEIERVPSTSESLSQQPLADFYVGQKNASLIITGNELWRSTVVTMGNQKADNIEVLPNMKGIIATFDVVNTPNRKFIRVDQGPNPLVANPNPCVVRSRVTVWTSEGKTVNPLYVLIHPHRNLDEEIEMKLKETLKGEKNEKTKEILTAYPPNGFWACDEIKSKQTEPKSNGSG